MKSRLRVGPAAIAAGSAGILTLALTRRGILLEADSACYLWTSRLVRSSPTHLFGLPVDTALSIRDRFPPMYPVVLAVAGAFGDDLLAARIVGVLLAAASAWMLFRLVARHSSSATATAVALAVFVSRGYVLVLFGFLMSDGLYVMLALAALSLVEPTLRGAPAKRATALTLGAGAVASVGMLTRLAGVGLVLSIAVIGLLWGSRSRRWTLPAATIVVGFVPFGVWRLLAARGSVLAHRHVRWNPPFGDLWSTLESALWSYLPRQAIEAMGTWGLRTGAVVVFASIMCWSAVQIRAGISRSASTERRMVTGFLVVGWSHLAFLVLARAFLDPLISVDSRQTMLWLTCVVAAAGLDIHRRLATARPRARERVLVTAFVSVMLAGSGVLLVRALVDPGATWWNLGMQIPSRLAARAGAEPRGLVAYSNREDLLYLQTRRSTRELPLQFDAWGPDPEFARRAAAMAAEVRAGRAIVVVYKGDAQDSVAPRTIERLTGATVVFRNDEGVILASAAGRART